MKKESRLKFLGNGNAFSVKRGNTSAYIELDEQLLVIDCGEDVFKKLLEKNLLNNKKRVHFFISHLHSDHVGSLGSAIAYLYYRIYNGKSNNICVYHPNESIVELLDLQGIGRNMYSFTVNRWDTILLGGTYKEFEYIFEENEHVDELDYKGNCGTWSIELAVKNVFNIYYSADSAGVKERIQLTRIYDEIYHEVASEKNKAHTSYDELKEAFSQFTRSEKSRIWLMHMDDEFDEEQAIADGFNVTKIE